MLNFKNLYRNTKFIKLYGIQIFFSISAFSYDILRLISSQTIDLI